MKISEIKELPDGTAIDSLSGLVENVYERKAGKSKRGSPYSFQGIVLKDSSGTIKVTLDGRKECPKSMEGKEVSMSSVRGEKGLEGVLKKTDRYVDKQGEEVAKVAVYVNNVAKVAVSDKAGVPPTSVIPYVSTCNTKPTLIPGAKSGMLVNNAVQIIMLHNKGMDYYASDEFIYDVHTIAKSLLCVSDALEFGEELKRPAYNPKLPWGTPEPAPKQEESADQNFLEGGQADPEIF